MLNLSESLPSRLRELRTERGWSLAELADRAGTTASQVMKLEKGQRRLNLNWIARFASAFGISEAELMDQAADFEQTPWMIPVVREIISGNWKQAIENQEGMVEPVVGDLSQSSFALRTRNRLMDSIIQDGGFAVIDPEDVDLITGKIYAVVDAHGNTAIRRFLNDPARLEPCSSRAEHQTISLARDQFTIIGMVKGAWVNV